jgi:hypothetical protein
MRCTSAAALGLPEPIHMLCSIYSGFFAAHAHTHTLITAHCTADVLLLLPVIVTSNALLACTRIQVNTMLCFNAAGVAHGHMQAFPVTV